MRLLHIVTLACVPALALAAARAQDPSTFLIEGVRVFDGERMLSDRDVLVQHGQIVRVGTGLELPRGAARIDGRGRTLLPGLIDAHVHLSDSAAADLRQALALGITTVVDMWSGAARFERIRALRAADAPDLASVLTAGVGATAPGGHPAQMGGPPFPTIGESVAAPRSWQRVLPRAPISSRSSTTTWPRSDLLHRCCRA